MASRQEGRQHPRIREEHRVTVRIVNAPDAPEAETRTYTGSTYDTSVAGLRIWGRSSLPAGTTVEMEIAIPHPRRVFQLRGRVVWSRRESERKYAAGIQLDGMPKAEMNAWRKQVSSLSGDR